jgi:hypothetical protein
MPASYAFAFYQMLRKLLLDCVFISLISLFVGATSSNNKGNETKTITVPFLSFILGFNILIQEFANNNKGCEIVVITLFPIGRKIPGQRIIPPNVHFNQVINRLLLDSKAFCEFSGSPQRLLLIALPNFRDRVVQRIVGIGRRKQGLDAQQDGADLQRR